jgi:hypothetical protein
MMSEEEGVIRMSISVPRQLKAEMETVDPAPNWSAIACEAFRAQLLRLASRRQAKNLDAVIARMRAAQELECNASYQEGRQAGEVWARETATPKQLRNLFSRVDECQLGGPETAEHLWEAIYPHEELDHHSVSNFWTIVLGENGEEIIEDEDFARGWAEGALDVWEKVEGQL